MACASPCSDRSTSRAGYETPAGNSKIHDDAIKQRIWTLQNASHRDLREVTSHALSVAHGLRQNSSAAIRAIQAEVSQLSPHPAAELLMHWLVLISVPDSDESRGHVQNALAALPQSHFSIYHFDSSGLADVRFASWHAAPWYYNSRQIVHRGFKRGSGCTIEALMTTVAWMLGLGREHGFTHLWKVDSDLDFTLFNEAAFRALVTHRAPIICQPAILRATARSRGSDRFSLNAQLLGSTAFVGRYRLLATAMGGWELKRQKPRCAHPPDDVESTCPLIEARVLPALYAALRGLHPRSEMAWGAVMNMVALRLAGVSPNHSAIKNRGLAQGLDGTFRPAALVFDWTPLIHRDTRLNGYRTKVAIRTLNGSSACSRSLLPGQVAPWEAVADNAVAKGEQAAWLAFLERTGA